MRNEGARAADRRVHLSSRLRVFINYLPSRRRTDHLPCLIELSTFEADLTRLRALLGLVWVCGAAHQLVIIEYKCRGVRRPLDGSHVNFYICALNVEFLHAGRRHRHEGTCERKEEEGDFLIIGMRNEGGTAAGRKNY